MNIQLSFSPVPMIASFVFGVISSIICAAPRKLARRVHSSSISASRDSSTTASPITSFDARMWSSRIASTILTYAREVGFSASSAASINLPYRHQTIGAYTITRRRMEDEPVRRSLRFGVGTAGGTHDGDLVVLHGGSGYIHQSHTTSYHHHRYDLSPTPVTLNAHPVTYPTIFSAICAGNFPTLVPPNFWIIHPPVAVLFFLRSSVVMFARRRL